MKENAREYINASGGMELYSRSEFGEKGIQLKFLHAGIIEYEQLNYKFVPGLSIIDVLMFNGPEQTRTLLNNFQLK
jgi:hypothetical protein